MTNHGEDGREMRRVTSLELSKKAVAACWVLGLVMLAAGVAATFIRDNQAGTATLILFGSLLVVLALMGRVPLRFEVGSTKLDATYETDRAFDAGRELGVAQGLEVAVGDVKESVEKGDANDAALDRISEELERVAPRRTSSSAPADNSAPTDNRELVLRGGVGFRGPTVCSAAGITYRQLDYWARTGLVEPSLRQGRSRLYSFRDVVLLKIIKRLLDTGVALQNVRSLIATIRDEPIETMEGVTLMSDGHSVYEAHSHDEVVDLVQGGHGVFGIAVGRVAREVEGVLRELPGELVVPEDDFEPPAA